MSNSSPSATPEPRASEERRFTRLFGLLVAMAAVASCGTATAATPGPITVRFDDPAGRLTALRPAADSLVARAIRRVEGVLDVSGVRITIIPDAGQSIGGYGLGGRTYSATEIRLFIDPGYHNLAQVYAQRLTWLVTHELHHAARWRSAGYGATLFEAMVSEGMADRFAEEMTTDALQPWSRAFPPDSTAHYLARARPEFDSRSYNHPRWFFDADPSLPRWTGYTLGYRLVSGYIAAHAGTSAATLVSVPASTFRP